MSKYVKQLITDDVRSRLTGVKDALLVNMIGLTANANNRVRTQLAEKGVNVLVVKTSLARRAFVDTELDGLIGEDATGTYAVCWGAEDIVSLAKVVAELHKDADVPTFEARGGIMDGEALTAEQVLEVSKWPSREEQISLLVGQITGVGATLAGQLTAVGGALASQIEKMAEGDEE